MSDLDPGSSNPQPRGPIDPRGAQTPPPPAPPGTPGHAPVAYYPQAPLPEKKGLLGNMTKIGGVISMILLVFAFGFYAGLILLSAGSGIQAVTYRQGDGLDKIAIIPISGIIMGGSSEFIRKVVDKVIEDKDVKAIVLRVDSPGGAVTPSDEIYHMIKRLKEERNIPIVASYGSVAASGGYYVSCNSDYIYVQPTTITGSIGVLGQVFTMEKLLTEKLGIEAQLIPSTRSTEKDVANNTFRSWNEKDVAHMTQILDVMYDQFIEVVYQGRKGKPVTTIDPDGEKVTSTLDTLDAINEVAKGKTYTAQQSIDAGLTDEIGYIDEAIEKARTLAGISEKNPPVVIYQAPTSLLSSIFGVTVRPNSGSAGGNGSGGYELDININADSLRQMLTEMGMPKPSYLMHP